MCRKDLKNDELKFVNAFLSGDIVYTGNKGNTYSFMFVDGFYSWEFYKSCCDLWILQEFNCGEKTKYFTCTSNFIEFIKLITK